MSNRLSLKLGYSPFGGCVPSNGIGPFARLFNSGVDLRKEDGLSNVHAVVLWGGEDISPSLYDEPGIYNSGPPEPTKRDLFEWQVLVEAKKRQIPVIGVCRGAQLACAFVGGKLVQHVNGHQGEHGLRTYDNTLIQTSSAHHQMMLVENTKHELLAWPIKNLSNTYQPLDTPGAASLEKRNAVEPEVVYFKDNFCLAIQGHPEWMDEFCPFNNWIMKEIRMRLFPIME